MFDLIIREAASRFGLGDKAGPLVQMLLAYLTNKDTGGLSGFISKLSSSGLGNVAQSWLGGGAGALPVSSSQIESLLGGQGGLLGNITSKLGIGGSTASSALGFLLPLVIGKLTPGGSVPTSFPSEVMGFITGGASAAAATVAASKAVSSAGSAASGAAQAAAGTAAAAGGGLMKWLPWLAAGIAALFILSYFNKGSDMAKQNADNAKATAAATAPATPAAPAPVEAKVAPVTMPPADAAAAAAKGDTAAADAAKATADAAAKAVAEAIPAGAGLVGYMANGMPALKVYFDTGKTEVAKEFGDKSKEIIAYLKDNAGAKAIISGYNDPTGNAAANAELSKNRAKGVAAALKAAGAADDRVVLEKPADTTTGAALSNAEARRVEVTIRK
jgi:outer membrane protein OmpA-like peptidoglycan-associated protein/uncharacterized protein YidB (DUF937 family)